ncbi:hypothetical protein [Morganella morganii]|uniref:hypothetical protein n=1 Tax=Morganella morganii TaxID=582 RepID=UPI003EC645E4
MTEIINNAIKGLVSFFLVLFINKALSIFRKRQLYLACWNSLRNTNLSNNSCTINGSIYNKGKDKEKNVEISMPSGFKISLVSSDYNSIKSDNNVITIDRVLPKQKISIIALIEGITEVNKKIKPEIKSEDANGKTFLTEDVVPPSMGWMIFTLSIVIFIGGFITYTETQETNTATYINKKYYEYKYSNLYEHGFSLPPFREHGLIESYNIKNNELPLKLTNIKDANGYINYEFKAFNPTSDEIRITIDFDTINQEEFIRRMKLLNRENEKKPVDSKENLEELKKSFNERTQKMMSIYDDHNIDYIINHDNNADLDFPLIKTFNFIISPKESKIINVNKKIKQGFTEKHFKMNIKIEGDDAKNEDVLYLEFNPEKSDNRNEFKNILLEYN